MTETTYRKMTAEEWTELKAENFATLKSRDTVSGISYLLGRVGSGTSDHVLHCNWIKINGERVVYAAHTVCGRCGRLPWNAGISVKIHLSTSPQGHHLPTCKSCVTNGRRDRRGWTLKDWNDRTFR